jgi:hypothetical protein
LSTKAWQIAAVVAVLNLFALPAAFAFEPFSQTVNGAGFNEVRAANGMILQWRVEGERLRVILDAPTRGWVGIGFRPENKMKGANFLIGYVRGAEVVISDQVGTRIDRHDADVKNKGTQDVVVGGGSESGNRTRIEFSIPLVSNDSQDKPLQPGERVPILLCFGPQDNFTKAHTVAAEAKGDITL